MRTILKYMIFLSVVFLVSCKKEGCTDSSAINFNSKANKEDGSCKYGPILTINGNFDTTIVLNSNFVDPGATATNKDGSPATLTIDNPVNTSLIGIYSIKYTASNENQTIEKSRKVKVLANIGQTYQGGIFFYYLQPNDIGYVAGEIHGFVCAPSDQSTGSSWGCQGSIIGTSDEIGTGDSNTTSIASQCNENNTAAKICSDLVLGGYSDWFLPSRKELQLMYDHLQSNGIGSFSSVAGDNFYWSSSEFSDMISWYNYFATDYSTTGFKNGLYRVRAIRKF